ncbi:MAG: endonuclease VIII [Acidobacteriota bacterium]
MPEGPEIWREAAQLDRALRGRATTAVFFAFDALAPHAETLVGRDVASVRARGKAMLVRFADGPVIYSHNQLYGRWMVGRADADPPDTTRQLRLAIHNDRHVARLYSASDIAVLDPADVDRHDYIRKLGPDAVDPDVPEDAILAQLTDRRFRRRGLGGLLLDQGFVAGIGNYLRSEILHVVGLHPDVRPDDLDVAEQRSLARAILALPRQSYETKGITNDLARAEAMKARGVRRAQYRHHVFARAGKRCYTCGDAIEKIDKASRRLYLCQTCQPAR